MFLLINFPQYCTFIFEPPALKVGMNVMLHRDHANDYSKRLNHFEGQSITFFFFLLEKNVCEVVFYWVFFAVNRSQSIIWAVSGKHGA